MATPTFQKGDRVAFKEFPEVVEGKVVELWRGNFYKVAWDSGLSYQGKTTLVSGNVIRKKAEPEVCRRITSSVVRSITSG